MLERLDQDMLHLDQKRRAGQRFEVVAVEFAAAAAVVVVGHVLRVNIQQVAVSVVVVAVVGDEVAVEGEVVVEVAAEETVFVKSVYTVPAQAEGTAPHRRGHRKLALVDMHMQDQGAAVVQDEAGIVADARVDADKHCLGLHTHMVGVGHIRIRRVVPGADRNRTLQNTIRSSNNTELSCLLAV